MKQDYLFASVVPAIGPATVTLLGYDLPVLSAILGVAGVVLALALAPPPKRPLTGGQGWALRIVLVLLTLALIIYDEKTPLISLGWAIGLGFSGYTVIELLGSMIPGRLRALFGAPPEDDPAANVAASIDPLPEGESK